MSQANLITPFLAQCGNRVIRAKPIPDFMELMSNDYQKIDTLQFNFFVRWNDLVPQAGSEWWFTSLLEFSDPADIESISLQDVKDAIGNSDHSSKFKRFTRLATKIGVTPVWVILPENSGPQVSPTTPLWTVNINPKNLKWSLHKQNIHWLISSIRNARGAAANMGRKGLRYGTSMIECFLSSTTDIYPGDVDAVILSDDEPVGIVEIKKHTLDSPIDDHLVERYYPKPDRRKYDSLYYLAQQIGGHSTPCPIWIMYCATRRPEYRLQQVDLTSGLSVLWDSGTNRYGNGDISSVVSSVKHAIVQ